MSSPKVLISGAGIAGLSLARLLSKAGIDYVIIEKRANHALSGSGIALPFNAIMALRTLGLADQVLDAAHQVHQVTYAKKNGQVLANASLDEAPLNKDKFVALKRTVLHDILATDIAEQIHYETVIETMEQVSDGVELTFSNADLNGKYDLVVAAEGIHSPLRKQCYPDEMTVLDRNIPTWRFVVDYPNHGLEPLYMFARTELFMAYPLGPDSLYCYGHIYDETDKFSQGNAHQHLHDVFGDFGGEVPAILRRAAEVEVLSGRLQSVAKPYYSSGRIVFVGDAGNACSPLLQQGAAAAFEDVICLAEQLQKHSIEQAISSYQDIRSPRVEWIVKSSDGPIKMMKKMRNPIGAFLRNMMIKKKGPLNVHGWRYLATDKV